MARNSAPAQGARPRGRHAPESGRESRRGRAGLPPPIPFPLPLALLYARCFEGLGSGRAGWLEATVEGTVGRTVGGGRIVRGWGVPAWMTCRRWTARQTRPGPVRSRAARALSAQSRLATFRSQLDGDRQGDADSSTRGRLCSKPRAAGAACPIGTGLHARLALCAQIPHWRGAPAPAGFGRIPHPLVSYLPLGSPPITFSLSLLPPARISSYRLLAK